MKLLFLVCSFAGVLCYYPSGKENFLSGLMLRDLVNRITHGKQDMLSNGDVSYLDLTGEDDPLPVNGKALSRELEEEQMFPLDYDSLGDINMHPSIRDQEYLQHSSLWGNRYNLGPSDSNSLMMQNIKFNKQDSDSTLPAYCNPPNPCPVGYNEDQGCITNFENTASFSRRYQAMQDCMCDTEHMFDCPNLEISGKERSMDSIGQIDFSRMLQQSLKLNEGYPHKNLVAKKFHSYIEKDSDDVNPFLTGEKLPVAAKKGINAF